MQGDRPSVTAACVAALRALYSEMPEPQRLIVDPLAKGLVPAPLALPARAVAAAPWAAPALHRALGFLTLGLSYHVPLRTKAIDDALREAIQDGVTQLVILGAGLDNRAMRLDELGAVRVFEVDHPSTQRAKLARLAALAPQGPKARALVRVPVDFERDRLEAALPAAAFDPTEPSFWIWEGVTLYLSRDAITDTLRQVGRLSAQGSRIALTYVAATLDRLPDWAVRLSKHLLAAAGEPFRTPLHTAEIEAFLREAGFTLISDDSTTDWGARYWPELPQIRPIERLAVGVRRT